MELCEICNTEEATHLVDLNTDEASDALMWLICNECDTFDQECTRGPIE